MLDIGCRVKSRPWVDATA